MAKRGPPKKFNAAVKTRIVDGLTRGMSLADMLLIVGFTHRSYLNARNDDDEFYQGVKAAAARGKERHLERVENAEERWQASAWFLERKYGAEYGNKIKLDVEGEYTMTLVEEIVEAPRRDTQAHPEHIGNGTPAPGAGRLPS